MKEARIDESKRDNFLIYLYIKRLFFPLLHYGNHKQVQMFPFNQNKHLQVVTIYIPIKNVFLLWITCTIYVQFGYKDIAYQFYKLSCTPINTEIYYFKIQPVDIFCIKKYTILRISFYL